MRSPATPSADHFVPERIADVIMPAALLGGPQDHLARQAVLGNQVDVGAARGDHDGLVEVVAQHDRGHAVGIKIMGVDHVEVIAFVDDAAERRFQRTAPAAAARPSCRPSGITGIARMADVDAVADFAFGHAGKGAIIAETRIR